MTACCPASRPAPRPLRNFCAAHDGLEYWDYNWRKGGGSSRMIEISKREEFYMQEYCGCVYSLRDTNRHRVTQGRERIQIGVQYYQPDES